MGTAVLGNWSVCWVFRSAGSQATPCGLGYGSRPSWPVSVHRQVTQAGMRQALEPCCLIVMLLPPQGGFTKSEVESLVSQLLGLRRHGRLSPNPGDEAPCAGRGEEPPTLTGMVSPSRPCSKPSRQGTAAPTPRASQAPFMWQGLRPPASSPGQCEGQGQDVKPQVVRTPACPCFNPKWISASQYLHTVKK